MGDLLRECLFTAFSALMAVGSSCLAIWAGRRDRDQDEHSKTSKRIDRHAVEIRHTQRQTKVDPFYPGDDL